MKQYIKSLLTPDHINSLIRGLVKIGGGALVTAGYVKQSQLAEVSGIVLAALGQFASSVFHFDNQQPDTSVTPPVPTTVILKSN